MKTVRNYRRGPYRKVGPESPLRRARLGRGVTQEELAVRMGVDESTVSKLECGAGVTGKFSIDGRPSLRARAAAALGVPVEELFPEWSAT
jgi:transcriptional regulator with XRE-family HTH domain